MSASTVSITANPASTRRRSVVVTGQKSATSIEIVPVENGGIAGLTGEDKGKDLSQSIRAESKDLASVKKTQANSTVSPRRTRKSPLKPEKPWWMTAVSIFAKNFVLLIVVLGLVQLIRSLSVQPSGTNPVALTDFEGRIAEVEGLLKKTSKMIQVQVDVVDKKVKSEIGTLREEMSKRIEEETKILEVEFKKLEAKSENMESYLSELKGQEWFSKQDFDNLLEDLKKSKGGADGENNLSLDDIKAYAREAVLKEIEKHAADGLGRVDYALASGGAVVSKHSETFAAGKGSNWFSLIIRHGVQSDATKMLTPSFGEPGQCFPLKGSSGFVQIRLRKAIIPEAVTLEHVAKSVAYDRSSAPKDCRITGWLQGDSRITGWLPGDSDADPESKRILLLSEFTYDLEKSNAQTFNVLDSTTGIIDTVRFDFTSNHGSPTHTCIYRLRVHGQEPTPDSLLAMES